MFAKRIHTLIFVTLDYIARVDLSNGKSIEVERSSCMDRTVHRDLGDSVETALRLHATSGSRVYVFTDEIWSGNVSLEKVVADAVSPDQLEQTLSLEVEYDTGNSPFDSRLCYSRTDSIDGDPTWWVAQIGADQLQAVITAASNCNGKLIAVSSVSTAHSTRQLSQQFAIDPTSPNTCAEFAKDWLTRYLRSDCDLAVIRVIGQPKTAAQTKHSNMLTAALTLAFFVMLHQIESHQLASAKGQLTDLVVHEKALRKTLENGEQFARQAQESKLRKEMIEKERIQRYEKQQRELAQAAAARRRPVQVLRALSATADPSHCIQYIKIQGNHVTIAGIAVSSTSVTRLAHHLEQTLSRNHWIVQTANLFSTESSLLTRFDMTLVPINTLPRSSAAAGGDVNRVR